MKYKTTAGVEVEIAPITLDERDKYLAIRDVQEAFHDEMKWEERLALHDAFLKLCQMCGIKSGCVGEGDIVPIISILINGEIPKN